MNYTVTFLFHSEKKLECHVLLLDAITTWDENNSCSLKNLQPLLQPRQLRYLCAIVALPVSLLWKVGVYGFQCRFSPLRACDKCIGNCQDQLAGDVQGTVSSSQYRNEHNPS